MTPSSGGGSPLFNPQVEGYDGLPKLNIINLINSVHVKSMAHFEKLEVPHCYPKGQTPLTISESAVLSSLADLNPGKAAGPAEKPNWLLKE